MSNFWKPVETWGEVVRDVGRFVTFRMDTALCDRLSWRHFAIGLLLTWLVGIARNWDLPSAPIWASLGLASVAYIFAMAFAIWFFTLWLAEKKPSYWRTLTMVALTATPGLIYGIPVEMMMDLPAAKSTNLAFLFLVATYRVALALTYMCRAHGFSFWQSFFTLGAPICAIIIGLHASGRVQTVLDMMGGNRDRGHTVSEAETEMLNYVCCYSLPVGGLFLLIYLALVGESRWSKERARRQRLLQEKEAREMAEEKPSSWVEESPDDHRDS